MINEIEEYNTLKGMTQKTSDPDCPSFGEEIINSIIWDWVRACHARTQGALTVVQGEGIKAHGLLTKNCIRCFKQIQEKEADGIIQYHAIEIPKFNNLGLDEGLLCDDCQGALTVIRGSGIKAHEFLTNHPRLSCERCGHSWEAESAKLPGTCPNQKCRSPYWNRARTKGV